MPSDNSFPGPDVALDGPGRHGEVGIVEFGHHVADDVCMVGRVHS